MRPNEHGRFWAVSSNRHFRVSNSRADYPLRGMPAIKKALAQFLGEAECVVAGTSNNSCPRTDRQLLVH